MQTIPVPPTAVAPTTATRTPLTATLASAVAAAGGVALHPERAALDELRHEIGNVLTPALGYVDLLAKRAQRWTDERDRRALAAIGASLRRLRLLVRLPSGAAVAARAPSSLRAAVEDALSQVPPERLPDLAVRWDGAPPEGEHVDAPLVCQVLANLLDNAAKYSAPGSPIAVRVAAAGGTVAVEVRDHGIGFDPADAEAIFRGHRTPAARETAAGSGIGLPLCRRLAEAAGGRLTAEAARAGGSTFLLTVPLSPAGAAPRTPQGVGAGAPDPGSEEHGR